MKMQSAYDIAKTRSRDKEIRVRRVQHRVRMFIHDPILTPAPQFTASSSARVRCAFISTIAERGLSFERLAEMDWDAALMAEDMRHDYGEQRLRYLCLARWSAAYAVVTARRGSAGHQLEKSQPERGTVV